MLHAHQFSRVGLVEFSSVSKSRIQTRAYMETSPAGLLEETNSLSKDYSNSGRHMSNTYRSKIKYSSDRLGRLFEIRNFSHFTLVGFWEGE
jgi:hypothetical protein